MTALEHNFHIWASSGICDICGNHTSAPTSETAKEPLFRPEDMQLDETSRKLLWNEFYASKDGLK